MKLDQKQVEIASLLENYLQEFFQQQTERYAYGELFEPLYLDLTEYVTRRGKRIRPLLFLHSYQIFGGECPIEDKNVLKVAVALELLHAFILMHDDVIDQSERRRGLPTFHKIIAEHLGRLPQRDRIGANITTVMGDMLFALSIETLHHTNFPAPLREAALNRFLQYLTDTGAGEVQDILLGVRDLTRATVEDIEQMYTLKTTRYTFEAPYVLGAILAGAQDEAIAHLPTITDPLGLAFQIQNDLIEFSHFDLNDRAMQADLLQGKKTLLMRVAFDCLKDLDRSFLQLCLGACDLNDSSILKIRELIEKAKVVPLLEERIRSLFQQAEKNIAQSAFTPNQQEGLRGMIQLVRQLTQAQ